MVAPKVKIRREITGEPLKIKFPRKVWDDVGKVFVENVRQNILTQKQADGSPLKQNKRYDSKGRKSTYFKKLKNPRVPKPVRSLVGVGKRLIRKGSYIIKKIRNGVAVEPKHNDIAGFVMKKGYTGWFGVNRKGQSAIAAIFRKAIKKMQKKAAKKRKVQTKG